MTIHVKIRTVEDEPVPDHITVEVSQLGERRVVSMIVSPEARSSMGEAEALTRAAVICVTTFLREAMGMEQTS